MLLFIKVYLILMVLCIVFGYPIYQVHEKDREAYEKKKRDAHIAEYNRLVREGKNLRRK